MERIYKEYQAMEPVTSETKFDNYMDLVDLLAGNFKRVTYSRPAVIDGGLLDEMGVDGLLIAHSFDIFSYIESKEVVWISENKTKNQLTIHWQDIQRNILRTRLAGGDQVTFVDKHHISS